MIIQDNMNFGLYGQILLWVLEILPYLEKNNINPIWDISSPYYGNIFGKYILPLYIPDSDNNIVTLTEIKTNYAQHFENDFYNASRLWKKFFSFSNDVYDKVEYFIQDIDMERTLGLHYRGTDKIDTEGGYINSEIFINIVDDYLSKNESKIDNIIIFSDEKVVLNDLFTHFEDKYKVYFDYDFFISKNEDLLFSNNIKNNIDVDKHLLNTLRDMIVLSKCKVILKTSSQLSAWPKIINPEVEIYRVSSFIHDWFPDSRIPLYKSDNENISILLSNLYKNEVIK